MDRIRQEKIQKYEEFIDRQLKPDLVHAIAERDKVFEQQKILPDTRHIFVDIGLGFYVEFTWSEALTYISAREEMLDRQIADYTRQIASLKTTIKLVCGGIRELLDLQTEGS